MNSVRWILASIFLGLFSPVVLAQSDNIIVSHYEPLQRLSIQSANPAISQKIGTSGPVTLNFDETPVVTAEAYAYAESTDTPAPPAAGGRP